MENARVTIGHYPFVAVGPWTQRVSRRASRETNAVNIGSEVEECPAKKRLA